MSRVTVKSGTGVTAELAAGLRTTAAHSTLVLDDTNSTRIRPDGALGRGVEEVVANRQESEEGSWLDLSHDGYARRFGMRHRRRLFLSADGSDLRGEDALEPVGGRLGRARKGRVDVRFHLASGVEASPTVDGLGALLRLP
ncbi:MAG: heparinase II/III-family protein, partial [Pirellulaceae bacterium]|nr:heparinase II/III-family protein [Pirellulaceae bacterium]